MYRLKIFILYTFDYIFKEYICLNKLSINIFTELIIYYSY